MPRTLALDGRHLSFDDLRDLQNDVSQGEGIRLKISAQAIGAMKKSRAILEKALARGETVYGANTGFGRQSDTRIDNEQVKELQINLLRSHAVGHGPPLGRAGLFMALRANSLARGQSGVRPDLVRMLVDLYNRGIQPAIRTHGSVGASGDLAPLANLGLVMIGEGDVFHGKWTSAALALKRAGLKPYQFQAKEALSLINGTQLMSTQLIDAAVQAETLLKAADVAGAMSLEALKGSANPFDARVHEARPHPGQKSVAANFRTLLKGSRILESHQDCGRVQDAYSLRCIPQVHGAARDALEFVKKVLVIEVNSATDNPLILGDDVISAGNFHGQPLAQAADLLSIALSSVINIVERRIERLTNPDLSGLPAFLIRDSGLNSGFMMVQVAAAAVAAECRVAATPASVQTIPTGAAKEDHVSMGPLAARKCLQIVDGLRRIVMWELMCAAQALDLLKPLEPGPALQAAHRAIRKNIPFLDRDRRWNEVAPITLGSQSVRAVESAVGKLA